MATPPVGAFDLGGTTGTCVVKIRGGLRLVDISRIPSGTFFGRGTLSRKR